MSVANLGSCLAGRAPLAGMLLRGLLVASIASIGAVRIALADDGQKKKSADADLAMRPYSKGPLTAADFRCPPPSPLPHKNGVYLSAMTYTSLNYNTRYHWIELGSQQIEAKLTSFKMTAQVDRRQSWTTRPTDDRLLDHEQGHFDVTELWARTIQGRFRDIISKGTLVGHGDDETSAVADLNRKVDAKVEEFLKEERKAQDDYDVATHHGTYFQAQGDERRSQLAALKGNSDTPGKKILTADRVGD